MPFMPEWEPPPGFNVGGEESELTADQEEQDETLIAALAAFVNDATALRLTLWTNHDTNSEPVKITSTIIPAHLDAIVLKPSARELDRILTALANGHVLAVTLERGIVP
jgi:hypothetical protein